MLKELDRIKGNPNVIEAYRTGLNALFNSGVIDFLRAIGRPTRHKNGENHIVMASEAAWSSGWNDCLDNLLYLEDRYLTEQVPVESLRMDFGSLDRSEAKGDLTKDEIDAIKRGTTPKYDPKQYSNNLSTRTTPTK